MLRWISSFLVGRFQKVYIDNCCSRPISCTSGVPPHLGPLLFIIFIDDIVQCIKFCQCLMYADDVKLFLKIKSFDDCRKMQIDLSNLSNWCIHNCLKLNIQKCMAISFLRSQTQYTYDYCIDLTPLKKVNQMKDLGIIIDNKLTFAPHVEYIVAKANSLVGFIKRNSREFSDPHTLICLFISLVRSILEYADVIWNPIYQTHSDRIERVQRRFTKYIFIKMRWDFEPSYSARCQLLGILTLNVRRFAHDVLFIRDVLCYRINSPALLSQVPIYAPERRLRIRNVLFQPSHRTNYGRNEPISRALMSFNEVSRDVDFHYSRDHFKTILLALLMN